MNRPTSPQAHRLPEVVRLLEQGRSYRAIAMETVLSKDQVARMVARYIKRVEKAPVEQPEEPAVSERDLYGWEPLPAFHPITWAAIRI